MTERTTRPGLNKKKTQEQQDKDEKEKTESTYDDNEKYFNMILEKGNNYILLVTDNKGMASTRGKVHEGGGEGYELTNFRVNCWENIGEECLLCKLYEHYNETDNIEESKKFRPKVKYGYMCLDWKIFSEDPYECLGELSDESKHDPENNRLCTVCPHVQVCKTRKYAVSIIKHTGVQISDDLNQFLSFPDSDPTDISGARLINIIRHATGRNKPEGTSKYYEPKIVMDNDGGRIDLTSKENGWILDVIDDSVINDLDEIMEPNTTVEKVISLLSEYEKEVLNIQNEEEESVSNDEENGSEENKDRGVEEKTTDVEEEPPCFGKAFSSSDVTCVGDNNMNRCFLFDKCKEKTPVRRSRVDG